MKFLVIVAHPDDPEFFGGGSIARWVADGHAVSYVVVTGGDKGADDPAMTPQRLVNIRHAEQRAAAAVLGVRDIAFLDYLDGELVNGHDLQRDLARAIRRARPDAVVTTDPQTLHWGARGINHKDHRAIGNAVNDAIFPGANSRMYFPELLAEGLQPHPPREVYYGGPVEPNHWVDVTDTIDLKAAAVAKHASQVREPEKLPDRLRQGAFRMLADGTVRYWEAFRRVIL
jgi:LmbE family N-acetylglucosaminyl deacetylase